MDSKEHAGPGQTHRTLESQESHEQSCEPGGGARGLRMGRWAPVGGFGGNWGVITLKHSAPDSWTPMAGSRGGQWAEARWLALGPGSWVDMDRAIYSETAVCLSI